MVKEIFVFNPSSGVLTDVLSVRNIDVYQEETEKGELVYKSGYTDIAPAKEMKIYLGVSPIFDNKTSTWKEDSVILDDFLLKTNTEERIEKLREECNSRILAGFKSSCLGEAKWFDSAYSDQVTIQGLVMTAMLGVQGLTEETCKWKASGELKCYEFAYEQVLQLGADLKNHIQENVDRFNEERIALINESEI